MTSVEELRLEMDQLNGKLKALLIERLKLANRILSLKDEQGLARQDMARETAILESILTGELSPEETDYLRGVFEAVFKQTLLNSKRLCLKVSQA
jgi:chorismate mutase